MWDIASFYCRRVRKAVTNVTLVTTVTTVTTVTSVTMVIVGHAMAHLVEALRYKPESHGLHSRWCHWNFSLTSFRPHYGPEVDSASNMNEYRGKGGQCVGLTTVSPPCVDCLEIWEPRHLGALYKDCFTFYQGYLHCLRFS
jgi:hypothetical protein